MNFLAHAYLSGEDEKILVGNFIGDFVKGRQDVERFEKRIAQGIALHRAIDAFTDRHPVVTRTKNRLRPKYRHYSGVVADVFYDHFLAANWKSYHALPLDDYAGNVYQLIQDHDHILPTGVRYMMKYMIQGNWLLNYAKIEGIGRALTGMSRRTSFESNMEYAVEDLKSQYQEFSNDFNEFFPDLKAYSENFLRDQARV